MLTRRRCLTAAAALVGGTIGSDRRAQPADSDLPFLADVQTPPVIPIDDWPPSLIGGATGTPIATWQAAGGG